MASCTPRSTFSTRKRKFNHEFYTNKLKVFYFRVFEGFYSKNVGINAFYALLNDALVNLDQNIWKFKTATFFCCEERLGMTS